MIKSTTGQHIKYNFYASLLSYILLLQRFGLKSQEQHASPQKPRSESTNKRERDLGRNLVSWQEKVVGNDPTGWNPRRAAGDGDTIRVSGTVLERERETTQREKDEWVWGSWNSHCPLLTPTRPRQRGSTARHHGSTARVEVPHQGR